jgi:hypothetical protein
LGLWFGPRCPNFDIHIEPRLVLIAELPEKGMGRAKACYTEVMPKLLKPPRRKVAATRRRAVRAKPHSEDEALNRICDQRLNEPRYPIDKLLKKMGYELER